MNETVRKLVQLMLENERFTLLRERKLVEETEANLVKARGAVATTEARIAAYEDALREAEPVAA